MPDQDPFAFLGIPYGSDPEMVRKVYHRMIKNCHPDLFHTPEEQRLAQEKTVKLNEAYEEALKISNRRNVGFNVISIGEAKHFAAKLLAQDNPEGALRQLNRATSRDGEWYCVQGDILMKLRKYEEAHASYREAIKYDETNRRFREGALQAAISLKKANTLGAKLFGWLKK